MDKVQEKLRTLLDYWIQHNHEHEAEFREWAAKIVFSSSEVAQQLGEAAAKLAEANGDLIKARQILTDILRGH